MIGQYLLFILGLLCLLLALALVFVPRWPAAVPAYVGLVLMHCSYFIAVLTSTFVFWGVMTLMVALIWWFSPKGEPDGHASSNIYIAGGTMAGCLLGIIVGARIMVLGTVMGALVGLLAYSRTPDGRWMQPSPVMMARYFAAKCLPAIVAVAITGVAIEGLLL